MSKIDDWRSYGIGLRADETGVFHYVSRFNGSYVEPDIVFRVPAVAGEPLTKNGNHPDIEREYERLIREAGYVEPAEDPPSQLNVVEMCADDSEQSRSLPCAYGNLVEGHAVYCHNSRWLYAPRKCRRTWYTGGEVRDEDCAGFKANPRHKP